MRFKVSNFKHGDIREVKRFCFLPIRVGNEYVWLETIKIRQKYIEGYLSHYWDDVEYLINKR